jgi:hypothetical protein
MVDGKTPKMTHSSELGSTLQRLTNPFEDDQAVVDVRSLPGAVTHVLPVAACKAIYQCVYRGVPI